jgi:hypothetical protein
MCGLSAPENVRAVWHRLVGMRVLLLAVVMSLGAAACTSSNGAPASPRSARVSSDQWFTTSEMAIKSMCHAYWVGRYVRGKNKTVRAWVTKQQYYSAEGTASGLTAKLQLSSQGYRVVKCEFGGYSHA